MATGSMPYVSPQQYLETERRAESKSEYIDGVIYAMSGGRAAHSAIAVLMATALVNRLRGRGCSTFNSDMQIALSARGPFFYPDVSVACGEAVFVEDRDDLLTNPVLIVEVLSPSTESYDRGKKFGYYRQLKSLREYVLVSQTEPRIETFLRDDAGHWQISEFIGTDAVCHLRSIDCEIPLSESFDGILLSE